MLKVLELAREYLPLNQYVGGLMYNLVLPRPDIIARFLIGHQEDTNFVRQLREDYPLLYLDVVRALLSGDMTSDDKLPIQTLEKVALFTGRRHTDYQMMFRLAERMLAEYPEAYKLNSPRH